jgi:hypothetical protein
LELVWVCPHAYTRGSRDPERSHSKEVLNAVLDSRLCPSMHVCSGGQEGAWCAVVGLLSMALEVVS